MPPHDRRRHATARCGRAGSTSTSPKRARATTSSSACTAGRSTGTSGGTCCRRWPTATGCWRSTCAASAGPTRRATATRRRNMATDVLAVLDELGLERVKLVGHDWGGWIGFLLCLREPQRFERYLALNILPPWTSAAGDGAAPLALLVPVADPQPGARLPPAPQRHVRAESPGRRARPARGLGPADAARLRRQPRRAGPGDGGGADVPGLQPARGAGDHARPLRHAAAARCRPGCSSAPTTPPCGPKLLAGYERHADDMERRAGRRLRPLHRRRGARAGRRARPRVLRRRAAAPTA